MKKQKRIVISLIAALIGSVLTFSFPRGKDIDTLLSHREAFSKLPSQEELIFIESKYEPCFGCHDLSMVYDENAQDAETAFRDFLIGKNLHHLHVQRQPKGANCTGCHQVGDRGVMLTKNVALTRKDNGGSCQPSCHRAKTYLNGP